ncbi:MAG: single-stranded DNA-binding protein [Spirochaetales bacterium]|nr:single-stranded DNA-binding protein [Spirochaetales bacterium]
MAADINIVVLVGRLTRESELKYTAGGTPVAHFSLAVNRRRKTADGKWEDEVSFIDCVLWGKQAETLNPYLEKGKQICVTGELRQSRWENEGQSRSKIEVAVNNIQLTGSPAGSAQQQSRPAPQAAPAPRQASPSAQQVPDFSGPEEFDDSDIPF